MRFISFSIICVFLLFVIGTETQNDFMDQALIDLKNRFQKVGVKIPNFMEERIAEEFNESLENKECSQNMTYSNCGGCEASCSDSVISCDKSCKSPGCYCSGEYVYNNVGRCILKSECSENIEEDDQEIQPLESPSNICPGNYTYLTCGVCHEHCGNINTICTMECKTAGCYCIAHAAFNDENECILKADCKEGDSDNPNFISLNTSSENTLGKYIFVNNTEFQIGTEECEQNEKWNECGNACENSCNDEKVICPAICGPGACVCEQGFVRNTDGECILKSECS
uniref:TIL domain-containing protein n=1 Tax=Parastrongyloides trichosuri TaxID=131310 RepID=A0A0N5A4X2_PARTI